MHWTWLKALGSKIGKTFIRIVWVREGEIGDDHSTHSDQDSNEVFTLLRLAALAMPPELWCSYWGRGGTWWPRGGALVTY